LLAFHPDLPGELLKNRTGASNRLHLTGGLTQLGKIMIEKGYSNDSLLIMNYDGTSPTQVILPVPAGQYMVYGGADVVLSPDGKTIFFQTSGSVSSTPPFYLYSCNIDGSGRKLIYTSNASANTPALLGAY